MFLFLKRVIFKLMELSLGLRPLLPLETRNPVFVNFRLTDAEREAVAAALPSGYELRPIRFAASDLEPAYWISYNLYAIRYPRPELASVRKARCEINTFVRDATGRVGVFVFCGSPYVSREDGGSFWGKLCDAAERLVVLLYGVGRLTRLRYELDDRLSIELAEDGHRITVDLEARGREGDEELSDDYQRFNDVSFFNGGKTFDLVSVNSSFSLARWNAIRGEEAAEARIEGPFFARAPDVIYYHRGDIGYLVSALHRGAA